MEVYYSNQNMWTPLPSPARPASPVLCVTAVTPPLSPIQHVFPFPVVEPNPLESYIDFSPDVYFPDGSHVAGTVDFYNPGVIDLPADYVSPQVAALEAKIIELNNLIAHLRTQLATMPPPEHIFIPASNYYSLPAGAIRAYTDGRSWSFSTPSQDNTHEVWTASVALNHG